MRSRLPIGCSRGLLVMAGVFAFALPAGQPARCQAPDARELAEIQRRLQQMPAGERERLLQMLAASRGSDAAADTAAADTAASIDDRLPARPLGTAPQGTATPQQPRAQAKPNDPAAEFALVPVDSLPRFGQELFAQTPETFQPASFGPVPEDYRLGPGDEVVVEVWGEVRFRDEYRIDRRGTVLLRDAGQATLNGLTLEAARREVAARLSRVHSGIRVDGGGSTFVDVSLGRLRAIRVFVVGEAARPGGYEVSSAATVFQALYAAGGPSSIGSLRDIRLIRDNRQAAQLDLYRYLVDGQRTGDELLREGDTVFIPVAQRTVALRGEVRRPARFELLAGEGLREALRFAGGLLPSARADLVHVARILPPSQRVAGQLERIELDLAVDDPADSTGAVVELLDGDDVRVLTVSPRVESFVRIMGSVHRAGQYAFSPGMRLSDLVERAGGLAREALLERALLVRTHDDRTRESMPVALGQALGGGQANVELAALDSLHVFSREILRPELQVTIHGEVRRPGSYPLFENMTLRDLVLVCGGLLDFAEPLQAEISRLVAGASSPDSVAQVFSVPLGRDYASLEAQPVLLQNHDHVFIRRQPFAELQRNVLLEGEIMYPGVYTLQERDERLSTLLQRAGGLLPSAFVPGFRLQREEGNAGNIGLDLSDALQHPGGPNDIILRPGDRVTVPTVPLSVRVEGEVGFPTSVVYERGKGIGHYIANAGGFTEHAKASHARVVYPNGTSKKVRRFWWDPEVKPGSTVQVPHKQPGEGVDWGEVVVRSTQVISSLATIVFIVDRLNE